MTLLFIIIMVIIGSIILGAGLTLLFYLIWNFLTTFANNRKRPNDLKDEIYKNPGPVNKEIMIKEVNEIDRSRKDPKFREFQRLRNIKTGENPLDPTIEIKRGVEGERKPVSSRNQIINELKSAIHTDSRTELNPRKVIKLD